ncbi:MAG: tRNA preQ1(34) S-adenosylmethionine ribosyltransferase-isomerase QueA [Burkholderiales bacterium]|nr:tRNA preQ1(34) S-adenosylmethionine ribosyltransferase-isomerase QueA [Burkholderiales bacterium]
MLKLTDFDYSLPEELIAATPTPNRDESRLLVVEQDIYQNFYFKHLINFIHPHDLIIFNDSKVIKARLFGHKPSGGKIELLVERILPNNNLIAHIRSNKTIHIDMLINLPGNITLQVIQKLDGLFELTLSSGRVSDNINIHTWVDYLDQYGHIPLPVYIKREDTALDELRYQTVYAKHPGSVAAPTAGLHFTSHLLEEIKAKGANSAAITLHVGSGTFKPVNTNFIHEHKMHSEIYSISSSTIDLIKQCKANGGNVIAIGTTSLRALETAALTNFDLKNGETDIFITPGFKFKVVDKLVTNFHLPRSTLLMLVSAFAGMEVIKNAYIHAIKNNYRFFSYGDAMLLQLKDR